MTNAPTLSYRDNFYRDIFTTALEGGIGYWSECSKYRWDGLGNDYVAIVHETDPGGVSAEPHTIVRSVIASGYNLAVTEYRDKFRWSAGKPPMVPADTAAGYWDFDAGDADAIVQLGLFGEVVYG